MVPRRATRQYIVLIDLSASRDNESRNEAQQFVQKLTNSLDFGDQLILLPIQQEGLTDHEKVGVFTVSSVRTPGYMTSTDRGNREGDRQTAFDHVKNYFDIPAGVKIQHTDIFATLALAADYVHDSKATSSEILILSDMLQSDRKFEMQHLQRMPTHQWISSQSAAGQLPRLAGACIAIIGEDRTSKDDPKIREFWADYFQQAQAKLRPEDVRPTAPASPDDICGN